MSSIDGVRSPATLKYDAEPSMSDGGSDRCPYREISAWVCEVDDSARSMIG